MKACVYVSVCDKIVQDTEPYRKENLPMIRYGTIGTNFIVDRFQEAAMENPSLHYSAVYSRNQETAGNFAAKYGVETTYTDLNAFACADDLDAVYIASPNSFHYEQAALLLSHGKHVLCEKPVTSNARELEHLIQLAGQNNVILLEAIRSIFTPGYQALAKHLPKLGTIRRASFHFCQYSSRYDKFKSGIVENAFNPIFSNGALMDIGVYCVHPLVRLFGMPEKIKTDAVLLENGIDGSGTILGVYKDMQAELVYSKISSSRIPSQIQGENGTITIEGIDHPHQLIFYDRAGGRQVLYQGPAKADMSGEIAEWLRLISAGPGSNIHNRYSLMALQVMDEARKQVGIVFPADETFA